jgi:hypothetical protein
MKLGNITAATTPRSTITRNIAIDAVQPIEAVTLVPAFFNPVAFSQTQ